jgi:AraC family transcriptional regulator of adaptative response / DNA-3-methyladenine glycosylase II
LEGRAAIPEPLSLQLTYRSPFDWEALLGFLRFRTLKGVEWVSDDTYLRTIRLKEHRGWIRIRHAPEMCALVVELTRSLSPVLHILLGRLRHLFDLDSHPDVIAGHLMQDVTIAESVDHNRGLRVPGAFDGFELAVRAVLGQQITVKAATTLAGRFADAFGDEIQTPHHELSRLSPTADRVAAASLEDVASLGIVRSRAKSIIRLAEEVASERLTLGAAAPFESTVKQLIALPGIGPWTAQYIAMRALRWPDAFPKEDIALRKSLGNVTAAQAEALSQAWRPWRSYATLHLWNRASLLRRAANA